MINITQSYFILKKETSDEYARKVLLENLKLNDDNVKRTASEMRCSRNTIYLAIGKKEKGQLKDESHAPKTPHPKVSPVEIVNLVVKMRKKTGFGKSRLQRQILIEEKTMIPQSTIGKILKREKLARSKKRVRREYSKVKYHWDKILPFEQAEIDTKDILDKQTLPLETYEYLKRADFIPQYQWTFIEPVTRIRFLSWSYTRDWACGQVFGKMVIWWLKTFGFDDQITLWSDGGTEFNASQLGGFSRAQKNFWQPLEVKRQLIRKGHPEDNPFVERSHETDDFEFYIPYLKQIKSEKDFLKLAAWWIRVYNTVRTHLGINNLTPYQKLKSLGYLMPEKFCLFPAMILDRLVTLPEILSNPKSVQEHLDYDQTADKQKNTPLIKAR